MRSIQNLEKLSLILIYMFFLIIILIPSFELGINLDDKLFSYVQIFKYYDDFSLKQFKSDLLINCDEQISCIKRTNAQLGAYGSYFLTGFFQDLIFNILRFFNFNLENIISLTINSLSLFFIFFFLYSICLKSKITINYLNLSFVIIFLIFIDAHLTKLFFNLNILNVYPGYISNRNILSLLNILIFYLYFEKKYKEFYKFIFLTSLFHFYSSIIIILSYLSIEIVKFINLNWKLNNIKLIVLNILLYILSILFINSIFNFDINSYLVFFTSKIFEIKILLILIFLIFLNLARIKNNFIYSFELLIIDLLGFYIFFLGTLFKFINIDNNYNDIFLRFVGLFIIPYISFQINILIKNYYKKIYKISFILIIVFALFFYEFIYERFNIAKYNIKTINNELNLYLEKHRFAILDLSNKNYRDFSFKNDISRSKLFLYQITKYKN